MFSVLMAIAVAIIFTLGIFHFFGDQIAYLASMISQGLQIIADINLYLPTWLLPFIGISIGLAVLSIIVKLI